MRFVRTGREHDSANVCQCQPHGVCAGLPERQQRTPGTGRHTIPATIGITWDQASKDKAVDVAGKAMTDFARPTMEDEQWANDLARWLTPRATADYSAVDPANIPASRVTGPATLAVDETNGFGVKASVPTNAGTYTVQLLRTGKDSPWKVNRLTPPAS
ncbi:hypothetical protein BJG92_03068 [Arthrobacter sp. SO5]|nr:hypothetical protein [Arthrobacter sp. SO5]